MSGLPEGWVLVNPLDVASPVRGVTYKKEQAIGEKKAGYTAVLRANNIQNDEINLSDIVYVPDENIIAQQRLKINDIVIAMSSGSISVVGKSAQVKEPIDASFGAFCGVLRPNSSMEPRYLGYFLKSSAYRTAISDMARGVNINNLKWGHFKEIDLPLAPLPEQTRIADKLDRLLARVDACRERVERVPGIIKRFRQSVLAEATSGKLTEEWREAQGRSRVEWATVSISALGEVVTGSTPSKKKSNYYGGDICFFKPTELDAGYNVSSSAETLSMAGAEQARILPALTVMVTCIGSIGKTGLSRKLGATNQQINSVICNKSVILPQWLYFWFCSPMGQSSLVENSSATTIPIINKSRFSRLIVNLPPLEEQTEIVRRVETLFAFADKLETRYRQARERIDKLTPALLAKAFRGELVPQNPADEPAAEMLKRAGLLR
jgi:type I restriction enzyme S subunit